MVQWCGKSTEEIIFPIYWGTFQAYWKVNWVQAEKRLAFRLSAGESAWERQGAGVVSQTSCVCQTYVWSGKICHTTGVPFGGFKRRRLAETWQNAGNNRRSQPCVCHRPSVPAADRAKPKPRHVK